MNSNHDLGTNLQCVRCVYTYPHYTSVHLLTYLLQSATSECEYQSLSK